MPRGRPRRRKEAIVSEVEDIKRHVKEDIDAKRSNKVVDKYFTIKSGKVLLVKKMSNGNLHRSYMGRENIGVKNKNGEKVLKVNPLIKKSKDEGTWRYE